MTTAANLQGPLVASPEHGSRSDNQKTLLNSGRLVRGIDGLWLLSVSWVDVLHIIYPEQHRDAEAEPCREVEAKLCTTSGTPAQHAKAAG